MFTLSEFPNKVLGIVFLDAALNHAVNFDSLLAPYPQQPQPDSSFKPTRKNIHDFDFKMNRFPFPDGELNALGNFDKNTTSKVSTSAGPIFYNRSIHFCDMFCIVVYKNATN